jgi:gluconolactonase
MNPHLTTLALACTLTACLEAQSFVIYEPQEFDLVVTQSSRLTKLAEGMRFAEGPVWVGAQGGYLIFSDVLSDELKRWSVDSELATYRKPSHQASGNCVDLEGRLISAEHQGRRLAITEKDGQVRTLVDRYQGKRLNSPNDVMVKSDASVWFTDPGDGLGTAQRELDGNYVYRFEPKTGSLQVMAKDFDQPSGLCFAPQEDRLFIADAGRPHNVRVFEVGKDGALSGGEVFHTLARGAPAGLRCDGDGRLYVAADSGVHILGPNGVLIGKLLLPETPANLCFGGADHRTLFITARTSLYAIRLGAKGPASIAKN